MTDDYDRLYELVLLLRCQTGDGAAFPNSWNGISIVWAVTCGD